MTMRQHYYTSCERGISGGAGFQCKALSEGFSDADLRLVNSMIAYRIPPTLDEREINTHPVAFRYEYVDLGKCILVNSQSNGTDENGRPGNFFAHTVVTDPNDFEFFPPIMYWRHPFWKKQDAEARLDIPLEPAFEQDPSLTLEQIWPFLASKKRKTWFIQLLSAVINYDLEKRPIIILDDTENIALWIAAITFALPPIYRHYLTFATYHHDPYQSTFRITGTTQDSKFRFSHDEYISHFILNAYTEQVSDIALSDYAILISEYYDEQYYEQDLLDFFSMCNARLPNRGSNRFRLLHEKLDPIANFYLAIKANRLSLADPKALNSIDIFLKYIEQKPSTISKDDENSLLLTANNILDSLIDNPTKLHIAYYKRSLVMLEKHLTQMDHQRRAKQDMEWWLRNMVTKEVGLAKELLLIYLQVYPTELLGNIISKSEYIQYLAETILVNNWQMHQVVWEILMPLIRFDVQTTPAIRDFLARTLTAVNALSAPDPVLPSSEASHIINSIIRAIPSQKTPLLLQPSAQFQYAKRNFSVAWLYFQLIKDLPLAERKPYRQYASPDILKYEVEREVKTLPFTKVIPRLEAWIAQLEQDPMPQKELIENGVKLRWDMNSPEEKKSLAEAILLSQTLPSFLSSDFRGTIIKEYFYGVILDKVSLTQVSIYTQYISCPDLNDNQRAVIGGCLALSNQLFDHDNIQIIHNRMTNLSPEAYKKDLAKYCNTFFAQDFDIEQHAYLLDATYVERHSESFWDIYWQYFNHLLFNEKYTKKLLQLLNFWFEDSLSRYYEGYRYLVQTFFLQLPVVLETARNDKAFKQRAAHIHSMAMAMAMAQRYAWYVHINSYFVQQKGFLGRWRK